MRSTATRTTTIMVNAAFLQEVKESNPRLWAILHELRSMEYTLETSNVVAGTFVNLLWELREQLALQFSLEDAYGFTSCSPRSRPVHGMDATHAQSQHGELFLQIQEICEQAEEAQYRGTVGRDLPIYLATFEAFDVAMRAHEAFEAELIRFGLGIR